jgi:UDP-glucose 4-epimerase
MIALASSCRVSFMSCSTILILGHAASKASVRIAPTYVEDIAEIVVAAVTEGWTGTMNVASPQVMSLRELAELIGEVVGRPPIFETTDRETFRITPVLDRLRANFDFGRFTPFGVALRRIAAHLADAC